VHADGHRDEDVGDRIADVVEDCPEWALEIQFRRQNTVEVIHDVVIEEQGDQILKTVFPKEQSEWKDPKD